MKDRKEEKGKKEGLQARWRQDGRKVRGRNG